MYKNNTFRNSYIIHLHKTKDGFSLTKTFRQFVQKLVKFFNAGKVPT